MKLHKLARVLRHLKPACRPTLNESLARPYVSDELATLLTLHCRELGISTRALPQEIRSQARGAYQIFLKRALQAAAVGQDDAAQDYLLAAAHGMDQLEEPFTFLDAELCVRDFDDAVVQIQTLLLKHARTKPSKSWIYIPPNLTTYWH